MKLLVGSMDPHSSLLRFFTHLNIVPLRLADRFEITLGQDRVGPRGSGFASFT